MRLFAVWFLMILGIASAHAQATRHTPIGSCSISSPASPTFLNASTCSGVWGNGVPVQANYAVICAYTQGINWTDGPGETVTATAGTGGQAIAAGNCIPYDGNFNQIQFIQQTAGAVIRVTFYRGV